jgi:hypothetical protein
MANITFTQQQTALFLADGAEEYAAGQQDEISQIGNLTTDQITIQLTDMGEVADAAEVLNGTFPGDSVKEIGKRPRRPTPQG